MMKFRHRSDQLLSGSLSLHIRKLNDTYFIAQVDPSSAGSDGPDARSDHSGEVLYVVAVVFLWGFSIILLIASYVRKNRMDNNISLYLKEIQTVQRRTRKEKILRFITLLQSSRGLRGGGGGGGGAVEAPSGIRRVSSQASSLSYACCRSRSPSPTPSIRLDQNHIQPRLSVQSETGDRTQPAIVDQFAEASVMRHSYGCFLPEICIESDIDAGVAPDSSVSDMDDLAALNCQQRATPSIDGSVPLITDL